MPTLDELNKNVFLTHTTKIIPKDGVMIPGKLFSNRKPILPELPLCEYPSISRLTLHWYPQHFITPHSRWIGPSAEETYYIIERAQYLYSEIYGGYAEDFMSIGPHTLSEDALILVPVPVEKFEEAKKILGNFKGQIKTYDDLDHAKKLLNKHIKLSRFNLTIPFPQQNSLDAPIEHVRRFLQHPDGKKDPQYENTLKLFMEASHKNPVPKTIPLILDASPEEFVVRFDKQEYNAREFFSPWEQAGFYFGDHSSSMFCKLEETMDRIFAFSTPLKITSSNADIKRERILEIQKQIDIFKDTLKEINKMLKDRKFPDYVISYVDKISQILVDVWLPGLKEIPDSAPSLPLFVHRINKIHQVAEKIKQGNGGVKEYKQASALNSQRSLSALNSRFGSSASFFAPRSVGILQEEAVVSQENTDTFCLDRICKILTQKDIKSHVAGRSLVVEEINEEAVADKIRSLSA